MQFETLEDARSFLDAHFPEAAHGAPEIVGDFEIESDATFLMVCLLARAHDPETGATLFSTIGAHGFPTNLWVSEVEELAGEGYYRLIGTDARHSWRVWPIFGYQTEDKAVADQMRKENSGWVFLPEDLPTSYWETEPIPDVPSPSPTRIRAAQGHA